MHLPVILYTVKDDSTVLLDTHHANDLKRSTLLSGAEMPVNLAENIVTKDLK